MFKYPLIAYIILELKFKYPLIAYIILGLKKVQNIFKPDNNNNGCRYIELKFAGFKFQGCHVTYRRLSNKMI